MKKEFTEEQIEQEREIPQHVKDEAKVEEAIERMYDRRQQEMFDDEMWNWSGLRGAIHVGFTQNFIHSGLVVVHQKKKMNNFVVCFLLTVHLISVIIKLKK